MNTDLKNETQAEPVSATVQSGSVSIPFWVIDYAQKIELFMKVNGVDAWALGGIQSRDLPPAPQPQASAEDVRRMCAAMYYYAEQEGRLYGEQTIAAKERIRASLGVGRE